MYRNQEINKSLEIGLAKDTDDRPKTAIEIVELLRTKSELLQISSGVVKQAKDDTQNQTPNNVKQNIKIKKTVKKEVCELIVVSRFANWSLGLGVASFLVGLPTAIPCIFCGHIALKKIKHSNVLLKGRGRAITGLIIGYLILCGVLIFIMVESW